MISDSVGKDEDIHGSYGSLGSRATEADNGGQRWTTAREYMAQHRGRFRSIVQGYEDVLEDLRRK
jgi:hypothetical protein